MNNLNKIMKNIRKEWNNCKLFKLFEYQIAQDEYLLVNLQLTNKGIEFRFDSDNKPTFFSGEVIKTGDDIFLIKADRYSLDILDALIQAVDLEMTEGYLLPNNLYYFEG